MAILNPYRLLPILLVLLWAAGCSRDLGLATKTFACQEDGQCTDGFVCGPEQTCVPVTRPPTPDTHEPDTQQPDAGPVPTEDVAPEIAEDAGPVPTEDVAPEITEDAGPETTEDVASETTEDVAEPCEGCFIDGACHEAGVLEPGNPCKSCQPVDAPGIWAPLPQGTFCDDQSACTEDDACDGNGVCVGAEIICEDGIECTQDLCDPLSGCDFSTLTEGMCLLEEPLPMCYLEGPSHPLNPCLFCDPTQNQWVVSLPGDEPVSCDDGDPCTGDDQCFDGECEGGPSTLECPDEDGDPCSIEACVPYIVESNPALSSASCGVTSEADGVSCGAPPQATAQCQGGQCVVTCDPGFGDCNDLPDDGCEADLQITWETCGDCETSCVDDDVCDQGICKSECALGGQDKCAGTCVDLQTDPLHCGQCDAPCDPGSSAQLSSCSGGVCGHEDCPPNTWDINGDPADGCEYDCQVQGDGVEDCNTVDDDCDGTIDETFDTASDPDNCGGCGVQCAVAGAPEVDPSNVQGWSCVASACAVQSCDDGWWDLDGEAANGCEYSCIPSAEALEECNGADDDCDGTTDEGELCLTDDPGAYALCDGGQCQPASCDAHTWNIDGEGLNGCEYDCEVVGQDDGCDQVDDDCDGEVDEDGDEDGDECPPGDLEVIKMVGTYQGGGYGVTCALRQDGSVWCWGYSQYGVSSGGVPDASDTNYEPNHIPLDGQAVDLAIGSYTACAVLDDQTIQCWGTNTSDTVLFPESKSPPFRLLHPVTGEPIDGVKKVFSGNAVTCLIRDHAAWSEADGDGGEPGDTLWCWGQGGNLGPGPFDTGPNSILNPIRLSEGGAPLTGVLEACVGHTHACAIVDEDEGTSTWCWGSQANGKLGNLTDLGSAAPTLVYSQSGPVADMVDLACKDAYHTCGLRGDGTVGCWGAGTGGQLGHGSLANSNYMSIVLDTNFQSLKDKGIVSLTSNRVGGTCAVTGSGELFCWGDNRADLFRNPSLPADDPVSLAHPVPGLGAVSGLMSAGDGNGPESHHCVWRQDGTVGCWGYNEYGSLGLGEEVEPPSDVKTPLLMSSYFPVAPSQISPNDGGICAVIDSAVHCWGEGRTLMGTGLASWPVPLPGGPVLDQDQSPIQATQVAVSQINFANDSFSAHACAILTDGHAACWGANSKGQLGHGGNLGVGLYVATTVMASADEPLQDVQKIQAGSLATCAIAGLEQEVSCWGWDQSDLVSNAIPTNNNIKLPIPVPLLGMEGTLVGATDLVVNSFTNTQDQHGCAVLAPDGEVWCWGQDDYGQLGDGEVGPDREEAAPVILYQEPGNPEVKLTGIGRVAATPRTTCAITAEAGDLYCWGDDYLGQLGLGDIPASPSALKNFLATDLVDIVAGYMHFIALTSSGSIIYWGNGQWGVFGNDSTSTDPDIPTVLPFKIGEWASIFAGWMSTCAITKNDEVYCWGSNDAAILGEGTYFTSDPQPVSGLDQPIPD